MRSDLKMRLCVFIRTRRAARRLIRDHNSVISVSPSRRESMKVWALLLSRARHPYRRCCPCYQACPQPAPHLRSRIPDPRRTRLRLICRCCPPRGRDRVFIEPIARASLDEGRGSRRPVPPGWYDLPVDPIKEIRVREVSAQPPVRRPPARMSELFQNGSDNPFGDRRRRDHESDGR